MPQDQNERELREMETQMQREWEELTTEDLAGIDGSYDRLVNRIQQRYGVAHEEAERQVNEWKSRLN